MPLEKNNYSPFSKEFYIFKKGMSEEDAIKEAKSKRPCNKEYWIRKGYSEEEAVNKVKEHQVKSGNIFKEKIRKNKNLRISPNQIKYWINKGYSEEEAKKKVSERQTTFSKEICIEKWGSEEGLRRWERRQNKWQKTLSLKSDEEMCDINKRKAITLERMIEKWGKEEGEEKYKNWLIAITSFNNFASKEATYFFDEIYDFLLENYNINDERIYYRKDDVKKEFFLLDEELNIYFYDFCIRDYKIIIEYHGEKFHPNKNVMTEEEFSNWKQLFTGFSSDVILNKDKHKKEIALSYGFKFLEIFSNDIDKKETVINFLKENIKE